MQHFSEKENWLLARCATCVRIFIASDPKSCAHLYELDIKVNECAKWV